MSHGIVHLFVHPCRVETAAAARLVQQLGGELVEMDFLIELAFLNGRHNLPEEVRAEALITY